MSKKLPTRWGPRWSRWVGRGLARLLWNTEVRGKQNIPKKGAAIIVVNHVGFIDGPVVHGVIPRLSFFLIRADMFKGPLKPLLTWAAQIPVEGDGRSALAKGKAVLRRGDIVGVFPEGTRGGGAAEQVHGGAAWLAVQSGAPIIPTALLGTRLPGKASICGPNHAAISSSPLASPYNWTFPLTLGAKNARPPPLSRWPPRSATSSAQPWQQPIWCCRSTTRCESVGHTRRRNE